MPPSSTLISILIVDDERDACENLRSILNDYFENDIKIDGVANSIRDAEKQIATLRPDAVFLDIEMPKENAFRFLERIAPVDFEVVFVTAYDDYALKAFKLNAIDYILKPISISELRRAIGKLKEKIIFKKLLGKNGEVISYAEVAALATGKVKSQKITLKDNHTVEVVDFKDIYFVEAQGSYIRVVFMKEDKVKEVTLSGSLTDYEEMLPSDLFFRIHKSYVINCQHLKKIYKGDYIEVIINDVYTLPISRRRYAPLLEFLTSNNFINE